MTDQQAPSRLPADDRGPRSGVLSPVRARLADVRGAVATFPDGATWSRCAVVYVAFLVCALPLGVASGLLHFAIAPLTPVAAATLVATLLVHPAFTEEVVFRALLLPREPQMNTRGAVAIAVALCLYVAAHPLNAWLFWPAALAVFASPWYLALAALLGLACSAAYLLSRSIWPSVLMHWITVALWLVVLGGTALLR